MLSEKHSRTEAEKIIDAADQMTPKPLNSKENIILSLKLLAVGSAVALLIWFVDIQVTT
jgi:hypothetical protein